MGAMTYQAAKAEVRFWACFAVALALLCPFLFPVQASAQSMSAFMLCVEQADAPMVADTVAAQKIADATRNKAYQGLKCADCVLASLTAITTPTPQVIAVVYVSERLSLAPATNAVTVRARAPPRPHSCGPPSEI
jgi:hypothetical protein